MTLFESISISDLAHTWKSVFKPGYGWALYRFPGTNTVYFIGGKTTAQSLDSETANGFAIAPFYDPGHQFWSIDPAIHCQLSDREFDTMAISFLFDYPVKNDTAGSSKTEYINLVEKVLAEIETGAIQKAVPARVKQVDLNNDFSPFRLFVSLLEAYPNAFVYLLSTPKTGTWIGSTPETLLKIKDLKLSTLSLAGTKKSGSAENSGFTSKETEEQAIVTRYIRDILEKYCIDIEADGPHIINAGNVVHLATYFNGLLKTEFLSGYLKIIRDLHPTPAVCGMPLLASRDFILKHESFNRSLYSGFLGPITSTSADLFVNLRCMEVFRNSALLYAGAGVVKGSVPEKEWYETEEKMNTLQRFL